MELSRRERESKLKNFRPYPKQLEFMNDKHKVVALFGGNQSGKTTVGSAFVAYHLTGEYPSWYNGIKFDRPVMVWVAGESSTRVRDTLQEKLFGPLGEWGTGLIPKQTLVGDPIRKGVYLEPLIFAELSINQVVQARYSSFLMTKGEKSSKVAR